MKKLLFGLTILLLTACGDKVSKNSNASGNAEFLWDFSKPQTYVYDYEQTVEMRSTMGRDEPEEKSKISAKGTLKIIVKDENQADISLSDMVINMILFDENGPSDTVNNNAGDMVTPGMGPDGSFKDKNSESMYSMLFPLPEKPIKPGETGERQMQMPFNAGNIMLTISGANKLTFKGYENFEGRNCAVLEGAIDVSKLELPKDAIGNYKSTTTGTGTYYFDLKNKCYVGADVKMVSNVLMDTENFPDIDLGMFMQMYSDSVFKIRLKEIVE